MWPFFGQFLAHDITADRSPLVDRADPARIRNFRAPRANLEGLYGNGPVGAPYLYAADDPAKLLLAPSGIDVPRNHEGIALIGDPRNDAHLFTSQMASPSSACTTGSWTVCATTGSPRRRCSRRPGARPPGTTST